MRSFVEILANCSYFSVLIPLLSYLFVVLMSTLSKKVPWFVHCIAMLCILSFISDTVAKWMYNEGKSTMLVFNAYYLFLFLILCWFYYDILFKQTLFVWYKIGISIFLVTVVIVNVFLQDITQYQNYIWAVEDIILLLFAILFSRHLLLNALQPPPMISSRLWLNSANLFYFSFNFWLFVMANVLLVEMERDTARTVWMFHNANNIIKNIFFAIGIYASINPEEREDNIFDKSV